MNKHKVILNILKNKILFILERCEHNDNKISTFEKLSFLSKTSFVVNIRPFKSIVKNKLNENNFDINYFKDISNRKKSILTLKTFKEKMIKKLDLINIIKINALIYYYLIRNKENKLFSLIMNKIYDIFNKL